MAYIVRLEPGEAEPFRSYLGGEASLRLLWRDEGMYSWSVYGAIDEGKPAGALRGVIPVERPEFFSLDWLYVDKGLRGRGIGSSLFDALMSELRERGVKTVAIKYSTLASMPETRISWERMTERYRERYSIERKELSTTHFVRTDRIAELRKYSWYHPGKLPEPYAILPWAEYDDGGKAIIRSREEELLKESGYLSPFFAEPYEGRASYVVALKRGGEPVGWLMSAPLGEETVLVKRYYVYKEHRGPSIGVTLGSYFLESIVPLYGRFAFKVIRGNRPMEMIARRFFVPISCGSILESLVNMVAAQAAG
jgi:GNAT superfamily N-acetyltransferase